MKKVNELLFLSKLNEAQDNNLKEFYGELIETQINFDSECKIEKFHTLCKIYFENNNIINLIDTASTTISYIRYFIEKLNYTPLPKTFFFLNNILILTFKMLSDTNRLFNIAILYSKYLLIIKNEKVKEIISSNKKIKSSKIKICKLFKETKLKLQEKLNLRKDFFSILNSDSTEFQQKPKKRVTEFLNEIEKDINDLLSLAEKEEINDSEKNNEIDSEEDYDIESSRHNITADNIIIDDNNEKFYVVNSIWMQKFVEFKKFYDKIITDPESYKNFLFTGFDVDNVLVTMLNMYNSNNKFDIISFIGPVMNENSILFLDVMPDPIYEVNNSSVIYTNGFRIFNEKLYNNIKELFGVDFEIKHEKKYIYIKYIEIYVFNRSLVNKNISSLKKHIISVPLDITLNKFKNKILRTLKHKYDIDLEIKDKNNIRIYLLEYQNKINKEKEFILNQNFQLLLAYGFNLMDKYIIRAEEITDHNINILFEIKNESILYIEILDKDNKNNFLVLNKENICIYCKKQINPKHNIFYCDEKEKCPCQYCSLECKNNDKRHLNFHKELSQFYIQRLSVEQLLEEQISFTKNSQFGLTGLTNLGNTSYMNSALQCLSNCFQLTKYFLTNLYNNELNNENKLGTGGKICETYRNLLKKMWMGGEETVNPIKFREIILKYMKYFDDYNQHDAYDFLIIFLDKLHEDLNRVTNKKYNLIQEKKQTESEEQAANRWWKNHINMEDSIIVNLFNGQFKNTITCCNCGNISVIYDPFISLNLPIPSGRYLVDVKYFGYNLEYHEFNISITEQSTCFDVSQKILENLINLEKNDKKRGKIIKKKKYNTKKKTNNNNSDNSNYDISDNINIIELLLVNEDKQIYKILSQNENIFYYIQEGYELVSYEKLCSNSEIDKIENIYIYLTKYTEENFMWIYPYIYKKYLIKYPLAIPIKSNNTPLYMLYEKISSFLKEIKLIKKENEIYNNLYDNLKIESEYKIGFLLYLSIAKNKLRNQFKICELLFNFYNNDQKNSNNIRILDKYHLNELCSEIKKKNKINIIIINVDLKCEIELDLLPKIEKKKNCIFTDPKINLYDCLDLFTVEEKLTEENLYFCHKCKSKQQIMKKIDIYKEPYYLIICLKRFKDKQNNEKNFLDNLFNNGKNTTFIDFPIKNLDLSTYVSNSDKNYKSGKYNLIGIINHDGGTNFGHYTACCLNRNKWYKFNDEIVSEINNNKIVNEAAYILFYQKSNQ